MRIALLFTALWLVTQQSPTFRATTAYVRLDIVVTDDEGRTVTDLRRDELEIYEGRQRQTIADFEFVSVPLNDRDVNAIVGESGPANVTNAPPAAESRAFAFIIDEGTLEPEDFVAVKTIMDEFFRTMGPADVAAVTYMGRSDLGQDFTSSLSRLRQAAGRAGEAFAGANTPYSLYFVLRNVVNTMAQAPHARRVAVLIGRGMPVAVGYELRRIFELSKQSGVPIYTIDPAGLVAPELGLSLPFEHQTPESRRSLDRRRRAQQDFLRAVATNTGGRDFVNRWNLKESVQLLMQDNSGYYVVGFYPQRYTEDGKFHRVEVKATRKNVRVRAREGYLTPKPLDRTNAARGLEVLLQDGFPGGRLPLRGSAARLSYSNGRTRLQLKLEVGYGSVANALEDELTLTWLALDPDGKIKSSATRRSARAVPSGEASTIAVEETIDVPKAAILRLAVASRALGAAGTLHIPLDPAWFRD